MAYFGVYKENADQKAKRVRSVADWEGTVSLYWLCLLCLFCVMRIALLQVTSGRCDVWSEHIQKSSVQLQDEGLF